MDCDDCDREDCDDCVDAKVEEVKEEREVPPLMLGITLNLRDIQTDVAAICHKQMEHSIRESIRACVAKQVAALIEKQAEAIALEHVRPAVETIMTEGWKLTDSYGNPSGKRLTLRERIEEYLIQKCGDYNSKTTRVDRIVEQHMDRALKNELSEQIRVVKANFHAKVEAEISKVLTQELQQTIESNLRTTLAQTIKNVLGK